MINKEDKQVINSLKGLRDALYESLPKDKRKEADEKEIEYGADKIVELLKDMNSASSYCIIESFLECNPKIILDVCGFSNLLADMHDVFGGEKTGNMIKMAVPRLKENLKEKMVSEINELNNKKKEQEKQEHKVTKETLDEELDEIKKFLNDRGYSFEIELADLSEDND